MALVALHTPRQDCKMTSTTVDKTYGTQVCRMLSDTIHESRSSAASYLAAQLLRRCLHGATAASPAMASVAPIPAERIASSERAAVAGVSTRAVAVRPSPLAGTIHYIIAAGRAAQHAYEAQAGAAVAEADVL